MTAVMVDTNVLVYAVDPADEAKTARAQMCIEALAESEQGFILGQVIVEFYSATTRGREPLLSPTDARALAVVMAGRLRPMSESPASALEAIRIAGERQLHVYDARLIATAKEHGIKLILSENFEDGCVIEGVRMVDPFADDFDLEVALSGAEW